MFQSQFYGSLSSLSVLKYALCAHTPWPRNTPPARVYTVSVTCQGQCQTMIRRKRLMYQTGVPTTPELEKIPSKGLNTRKYANNAHDAAPTSLIKRNDCSRRVREAITPSTC